jgi:hypothetical protein
VRAVDEVQLRVREPLREGLADRGRAHDVTSPPPQRHRSLHVGELEPPRTAEVRELAREPQATVAERLDAAARIRRVARRIARRRRGHPPPPLEPARRDPRRDPRHAHHRPHVTLQLRDEIDGRHRADDGDPAHPLGRDGRQRERVRPARRPADDTEAVDVECARRHLRPRAQR